MSTVELHAQLAIRPGRLDAFKAHVNDILEAARSLDTDTLRFDWYVSDDGTRCEVHEVYENAAAFLEHGQHIMQARARLFADCVDTDATTPPHSATCPSRSWRLPTPTGTASSAIPSCRACTSPPFPEGRRSLQQTSTAPSPMPSPERGLPPVRRFSLTL